MKRTSVKGKLLLVRAGIASVLFDLVLAIWSSAGVLTIVWICNDPRNFLQCAAVAPCFPVAEMG